MQDVCLALDLDHIKSSALNIVFL